MKPLIGNTDVTIDDKNRLLIPAEIRKAIDPEVDGTSFYLVPGVNGKPWLWPEKYYEGMAMEGRSEFATSDEEHMYEEMAYGMACRLEWDKQGRILIPAKWLDLHGLGREITIVGMRNHAEVWDRREWAAREAELLGRRAEIAVRARQRRTAEPPTDREIRERQTSG